MAGCEQQVVEAVEGGPRGAIRQRDAGRWEGPAYRAGMRIRSGGRALAVGGLLTATVLTTLGACSTSSAGPAATIPAPATTTNSTSPTPSPSPEPLLSPFTGKPIDALGPVLVVKLDNTGNAQPHAGLDRADLVYLEEVEWGMNRIAAVFSSDIPDRIGPVRSARITDIELLAQYEHPAFAYSGAQRKLQPALAAAPFIDVSATRGGTGYSRDSSRYAPYNYFIDGTVVLDRADGKASLAHSIGFEFADVAPAGGRIAESVRITWPSASAKFVYDPMAGDWVVRFDGDPAQVEGRSTGQRAASVIVQFVEQTDSGYGDRNGGRTPLAKTVGTGTAIVLRDGLAYDVTWSRPSEDAGTTFTLPNGEPMTLKPGQQWVALVKRGYPVKVLPKPQPTADPSSTASPTASPRTTTASS